MAGTRITIYDIARDASTSVSTVSRVLNGSTLIPPATRRTVLDSAQKLGYEPRRIRRSAGRAVLNIVVFLPDSGEPPTHLFYDVAALFSGIAAGIGETRAHTIVALHHSTTPFEGSKLGDIDGCIFAFSEPSPGVREILRRRDIPTVVINRHDDEFASVVNDASAGFGLLGDHISSVRPGVRAAYLSVGPTRPIARYRERAVRSATTLPLSDADFFSWSSLDAITSSGIARIVDAGCRTLICLNDLVAVTVYERLLRAGLRVPEDVGLTGYDAAPVLGLVSCRMTTVDLAVQRMGECAAALLVAGILERTSPIGTELVAGDLVVGESLGENPRVPYRKRKGR